jgi:hypothetical protein
MVRGDGKGNRSSAPSKMRDSQSAAALIAMIYLCCGGITVELPTER